MQFIPYCIEEAFQFCYYQIPKELFTNEYYKGKTYKIYVGKINRKNYDSGTGNFTIDLPENLRHSNNYNIKNKKSKKNFSSLDSKEYDDLYANNTWNAT